MLVVEGDSATLQCCWRAVNHSLFRVNWLKNEVQTVHQPTAVRYDREGCGSALSPVNHGTCGCADLTLTNITHNHTGCYVCKGVRDKPILVQFRGNGTTITVTERLRPTNGTTLQSMFSLPQRLILFIFQTKSIFTLLRYQSLAVYYNIRQDRLGVQVVQLPAERYWVRSPMSIA